MLSDVGGWGVSKCSGRPIFILFIKEIWICAMTRRHAQPNIKMLLTRSLPFDSYVREWSHPLMQWYHCIICGLNRTRGEIECDVIWFCFDFYFVRLHARCSCCSIVCLCFQVVQIKEVDCKMSSTNVNDFWTTAHRKV